jgi:2-aminoethylphosphonate-pyruvate transaminase
VLDRITAIAGGVGTHETVPVQGSGTFAVEAMLTSFVPKSGKALVLINGAYGRRLVKMCEVAGHAHAALEWAEDQPVDAGKVEAALAADQSITHVAVVHCETTSGVLNPVKAVAEAVQRQGRRLLIDAMSAFGALALDAKTVPFDAVVASSNKCLEGVPGIGFCLARKAALEETKGNCPSLSLDLYDQWVAMEGNGQWRFTPPTHAILAFDQALKEFEAEGGQPGRGGRYADNCKVLVEGMRALGFQTLLPDRLQAPIIVTFLMPSDPKFHFQTFYDRLRERGFVIYPGKLTVADTFRIGCIGRLGRSEMEGALAAIRAVLGELGVTRCAPKAAA